MKILFFLLLLLPVAPLSASAAFTSFDSLVLGTEYSVGNVFSSDDLSFSSVSFNGDIGVVRVQNGESSGGSGLELGVSGIEFLIPVEVQQISLRYALSDPIHGLIINNVATPIGTRFSLLDGTFVDGVMISAVLNPGQGEQGVLTLDGPISSFVIGGRELWIDDVSITVVPEPSGVALLIAAGVSLFARRRTWRMSSVIPGILLRS